MHLQGSALSVCNKLTVSDDEESEMQTAALESLCCLAAADTAAPMACMTIIRLLRSWDSTFSQDLKQELP